MKTVEATLVIGMLLGMCACGEDVQISPVEVAQAPNGLTVDKYVPGYRLSGTYTSEKLGEVEFDITYGEISRVSIFAGKTRLFHQVMKEDGTFISLATGPVDLLTAKQLDAKQRSFVRNCKARAALCYLDASEVLTQLIVHEAQKFESVRGIQAVFGIALIRTRLRDLMAKSPSAPQICQDGYSIVPCN